jgi:hypothetical protein
MAYACRAMNGYRLQVAQDAQFHDHERRLLLAQPRIGPKVVDRDALRQLGVEQAVRLICSAVGSTAWVNRRSALERVLAQKP